MSETVETPGPVCARCFEPGADRRPEDGWWLHDRCLIVWRCVALEVGIPLSAVPGWLDTPENGKGAYEKWAAT